MTTPYNFPVTKLPKANVQLTSLGLGSASLGNLYQALGDDDASSTLDAVIGSGIGYIDTAPHYGQGLSERRVGQAVSASGATISTKVGRVLEPITPPERGATRDGFVDGDPFKARYDYSYDGVMRSFGDSQKRLNRETLDILLVHDIGRLTHGDNHDYHLKCFLDGGYKALLELKADGLIRAIGLGVNEWQVCEELLRYVDLDVVMLAGRYTLLEHTALDSFLPLCERRNISVLIGGPFNSGILSGGTTYNYASATPQILNRVAALHAVCDAHSVPLAAAALRFPLAHPVVASVVAGMRSPAEVVENVRLFKMPIPISLWGDLKSQGLLPAHAPVPGLQMVTP